MPSSFPLRVLCFCLPGLAAATLLGTSFDITGQSSDWTAIMQLDTETGEAEKLVHYPSAYSTAALGLDADAVWLLTSDGLLNMYNRTSQELHDFNFTVQLNKSLCDPQWGNCIFGMKWSQKRHSFIGMGLGYPFIPSLGHGNASHVIFADPRTTAPGDYGMNYVAIHTAAAVDINLAIYEDATAYDDESDTYYAVMSAPPASTSVSDATSHRLRPLPRTAGGYSYLLYAWDLSTGKSRAIPGAGANMAFPFVVSVGGKEAFAFNPARRVGLPNATFVRIDTGTGDAAPLCVGQHVPGLASDNSLVLDSKRGLLHGVYEHMTGRALVSLDVLTGRLSAPLTLGHTIRYPSVLM